MRPSRLNRSSLALKQVSSSRIGNVAMLSCGTRADQDAYVRGEIEVKEATDESLGRLRADVGALTYT